MVKALAKFNRPLYGMSLIFLLALAVRLIKANFFPFWHDEIITLNNTHSFTQALQFARVDHQPPLLYIIATAVQLISSNPFVLRFPHILAGTLTVAFAYGLFIFYGARRPLWLALPLVFHFVLVYYSGEIRFYSLILLFSLLTFWLGFELLFGKPFRPWLSLVLGVLLTLLALLHYMTYSHLVALGVALILVWLLQRDFKSWSRPLYLLGSYLFVLIGNFPWLDEILDNLGAKMRAPEIHFFDLNLLVKLAYKLAGGGSLWTAFIVFVLALTLIFWFYHWLIHKGGLSFLSPANWEPKDKFVFFLLVYLLIYFLLFWGFGSERILFHRYFLFLLWPFAFILLFGIDLLFVSKFKFPKILAGTFLLIFIGSHFLLLRAYFSSSYRVEDFRTPAQFIDELVKGGKTKVYIDDSDKSTTDDFKFYWKVYQDEIYDGFEELQKPDAREFFKDGIYLYFGTLPPTPLGQQREKEILQVFANKKVLWEDSGFKYLAERNQHPFLQEGATAAHQPGQYRRLVIFW